MIFKIDITLVDESNSRRKSKFTKQRLHAQELDKERIDYEDIEM